MKIKAGHDYSFEHDYSIVHHKDLPMPKDSDYDPLPKLCVSNSSLSYIKRVLLGQQDFGEKKYYLFGAALHLKDLLNKPSAYTKKFDAEEKKMFKGMLAALNKNALWQRLKKGAKFEHRIIGKAFGVKVRVGVDVLKGKQYLADLKSTSCENQEDFIEKCLQYDYPRQGVLYQLITDVKEVYFVGISKKKPYKVFVFKLNDYPELKADALHEIKFLIWYFKTYGYPEEKITKNKKKLTKEQIKDLHR